MKIRIIIILFLSINLSLFGQDGSDISYLDEKRIDETLVGKFIQIDFYNYSFGNNKFDHLNLKTKTISKPKKDTISIYFDNKQLEFIEIRNDDHYNNWFSQQFLETIKTFKNKKIRIEKMKVLSVQNDSIEVKLFGHYYVKGIMEKTEYLTNIVSFERKIIHQILVNSRPQIKKGLSIYQVYNNPSLINEEKERECSYCFKATENNMYKSPLLSDYHIKSFDYKNQKIELTELGEKIIEKLDIPLRGLPVVLTLNGKVVYEFWLWNVYSSFSCDRIFTYPKLGFHIDFGLPKSNRFGKDTRYDERLKKYLENNKKRL